MDKREQDEMDALFAALGKLMKKLHGKGHSPSAVASAMAAYGIRMGVFIDGPRAWAGALQSHAERVERIAEQTDSACAQSMTRH